VEKNDQVERW